MADNFGIVTRGRSRSKTPGLLFSENGDSKGAKKIPTISLIEEEEVVEVQATQSQRPKRQRRSNKAVTSDTSGETESPKNSQVLITETITTTTTTTVESQSSQGKVISVTNGSEEKKEEVNNAVATEMSENQSQSIFNNIFNAIKTSTPILSTKRSKKVTENVKSPLGGTSVDLKSHPAYKEYKEAGEYWNKYPKTDYTYSELSPHRRQLGSGIVNMPNLSRRSLEKYQQRVETLIQGNPQEESFLRRKFLTNTSFQKRSADLQYDSADEVDVSDLHQKLIYRQQSQSNFLYRFYLLIITAFSSAYSNVRQGVRKILYYRPNQSSSSSSSRYTYTPVKSYGKSEFVNFILFL